ncbi:unnamed protein product [Rhizophagus irregularis]|nr:unnamed protein product [Rhizophagus irregularis]
MNDTFNKAKEDGKLRLLMYRLELINDYERFFSELVYNNSNDSPNDNGDKEEITFDDGVDINTWYTFITNKVSQNSTSSSSSTPDHLTLRF